MPAMPIPALRSMALGTSLLLLAACGTTPSPPPPAVPAAPAAPAPPLAGARHYLIRGDLSDVRFLVYRAGSLASVGHNHVIQAGTIAGEVQVAKDFRQSRLTLSIPVANFRVDPPEARSAEGEQFAKPPDAAAIAGTAKNMLGADVLDAIRYPHIEIRSVRLAGPAWAPDVTLRIGLHGVEREQVVPVAIDDRDGRLSATAVFDVKQSDFAIAPLKVLGGALQVADTVRVRARIVAVKE